MVNFIVSTWLGHGAGICGQMLFWVVSVKVFVDEDLFKSVDFEES